MPVYRLDDEIVFPKPSLARSDGLLAVGGDLSVGRLLLAYSAGIFPWYTDGDPILWWSPDPRLLLFPERFHLPGRFLRACRHSGWRVSMDRSFARVIQRCADVRSGDREGTWITADMARAYIRLHELGYAHSVEVWDDGDLIGGLYGVSLGRGFFGESMFSLRPNASKTALAALLRFTAGHGFHFIDCQVPSDHLKQFGAEEVPRPWFLEALYRAIREPGPAGRWDWTITVEALGRQPFGPV